jgi:DNA-binding NarL/FixJ family response regulator
MQAERKPDLVLLDLRLKDGESFELISLLKAQAPNIPILVLSQRDESVFAERVLQLGANGYIMKQEAPDDLVTAMRTVLAGRVYVSPKMAGPLHDRFPTSKEFS